MILHAQKLSGAKLITMRIDGAKEFKMDGNKRFLDDNGTLLDDIPPYSPESNGRAERLNRTLLEKACTIILELNMMCTFDRYRKLRTEAVQCVVYAYNRTLTRSTHKEVRHMATYQVVTGKKLDLSNF